MANSADPDQLASSEANWSGSTLFAEQIISRFSRIRVNLLLNKTIDSQNFAKLCIALYRFLMGNKSLISLINEDLQCN